ncbi:MAG: hypothetical protein COB91_02170, partial [Nitrosopumilales archaeon]
MSESVFLSPKSIAVIGASDKQGSVGRAITSNIMNGYKGTVYPISPTRETVFDQKAYKSVLDVPDPIDLAVVITKNTIVPIVLEECGKKGIKGAIVITAGFKEVDEEGKKLEQKLKDIATKYDVKIIGKGGHSGMPERAINPVDVINEIMNRFTLLREHDCKLVITQVHIGNVSNVIATEGSFSITLRTKNEEIRQFLLREIERSINEVCEFFGATAEINHARAYPSTVNNSEVATKLKTMLDWQDVPFPSMASEDFSYFLNEVPGAFIWLGSKMDPNYSLHHPKFNFN